MGATCQKARSGTSILVVGSLNADIVIEIKRMPKPGETIATRNDNTGFMVPGGKGANQATAIAKSGNSSTYSRLATIFGNDGHADKLRKSLTDNSVDISLCGTCKVPSGQAFILLYPSGENSIIIVGGSNNQWPMELSLNLQNAIKDSSVVLLQQEIPTRVNEAIARYAKQHGVSVMMDYGGEERKISRELLSNVTLVSPNETELERATRKKTDTKDNCVIAARDLIKQGCSQVLVTLGKDGAILVTEKDVVEQPCFKIDKKLIVDTTGAGDCFRGAYAVAYTEGEKSIKECLRFASAAAALCIQVKGAQPSMPSRNAIEKFLADHSST